MFEPLVTQLTPTIPNPTARAKRGWLASFLVVGLALSACHATREAALESGSDTESEALVLELQGSGVARGRAGGAVSPTEWRLRVVNSSGRGQSWSATSDSAWLVLPIARGSLPPRSSTELLAVLDPSAARRLAAGRHEARVTITDTDASARPSSAVGIALDLRSSSGTTPENGGGGAAFVEPVAGPNPGPMEPAASTSASESGWTDFVPSADSRVVYVSSSLGSDQNDGLSPQHPKASLYAAKALMRNGYPDWLCLRRGDVWTGAIGQWITSGRSASEPTVITTYGRAGARPHLVTGLQDGLVTIQNSSSPALLKHVRVVGLHFTCNGYTGAEGTPRAIVWHVPFEDVLVEDCFMERFHTNVVIEPLGQRGTNFRMRRCVLVDAFTTQSTHPQGLYVSGTDGVVLEENLFDHNGWREDVPGAVPTIFRHNVYLQTDVSAVRATGNIFASGASHGLQARQGGEIEDNLFVNNAIALLLGSRDATSAPIRFEARHNVILSGRDINPATPRGFAIDVPAAAAGAIVGNVIAHQGHAGFPVAMSLYDGTAAVGLHDVVVEGNVIHDWRGPVIMQGVAPTVTGLVFRDNVITESNGDGLLVHNTAQPNGGLELSAQNRLWSRRAPENAWCRIGNGNVSLETWKQAVADTTSDGARPNYVDSERNLRAYEAFLGGSGSASAFLSEAREQRRGEWRTAYTAHAVNEWIRAGFEIAP